MATLTTTAKDAARDMHADFWTLAYNLADDCIEIEDGEECFNLHVFMERLTDRIDELLNDAGAWANDRNCFALDAGEIARYLWACMAIRHEGDAYPSRFRGKPMLD